MKLIIENYKNINHLEFDVVNNKLLLLGSNGVGKTNILEAIYKGYWWMKDTDQHFDETFLMNLDVAHTITEYYPHASLLDYFFPNRRKPLDQQIIDFLNENYHELKRPLLMERVRSAVESLTYSAKNKVFDPSSLAIIRLVLLNKLYRRVQDEGKKFIILIDNPELYCHPSMIDEICSMLMDLQRSGCLIVVATHSSEVISRMFTRFEELIKLTKDENGQVVSFVLDIKKTVRDIIEFYSADTMLTRSFSRSSDEDAGLRLLLAQHNIESFLITAFRDEIFTAYFSNVVVLGEGASEDVLFDYIRNEVTPYWISEYMVGFMSCLGKSTMPLYFITLRNLGAKVLCMFDYDRLSNPVHRAYFDAFVEYHHQYPDMFRYYYLRPDLENYLNMVPEERMDSLFKPVNIFNSTYLQKDNNPALTGLLATIETQIENLFAEKS